MRGPFASCRDDGVWDCLDLSPFCPLSKTNLYEVFMKKILITGTAGFIGFHVANAMLARGYQVVGLDSINDYYDVCLKYDRLRQAGIDLSTAEEKPGQEKADPSDEQAQSDEQAPSETPATPGTSPYEQKNLQTPPHTKHNPHAQADTPQVSGPASPPPEKPRDASQAQRHHPRASHPGKPYTFHKLDLSDRDTLMALFAEERFDYVIHLAAQAGVRYSLTHPQAYVDANITGFLNILEACRAYPVQHLVYASSSSVYGKNTDMPFSVSDNVDHPVSLYAASKKCNELMAHTYSHLFGIPATGLRFFTVYGPWGRPDMALFLFTRAILEDQPIQVFNKGHMMRDFTYVDDIVEGVIRVTEHPARPNPQWDGQVPDPGTSDVPHCVYNIGNGNPVKLMDFIEALENALGKTAEKEMLPMQPGDVPATWADTKALEDTTGYKPGTPVQKGIEAFVAWYKAYYKKRASQI